MKKLKYIILLLLVTASIKLSGQQLQQVSQYMYNDFVLNPAIAGVHDYFQIRNINRFQWIGMTDPPQTNSISFYGPHSSMDMGYGGTIYLDRTGPTSRTGISGSYAYNIAINDQMRVSMGLSMSLLQYRIDGTQLDPKDDSDNYIQGINSTSLIPDAGLGAYLYANNFYVGFSIAQLLNSKIKIFEEKTGLNKLKSHFYLTGGYKYKINSDWVLEPSAIIKATSPKEFAFDITGIVTWTDMVWGGLGYRFHEAITMMVGYNYDDRFYFGYAYDIGITELRNYNMGSHEIMIGYRFNDIK